MKHTAVLLTVLAVALPLGTLPALAQRGHTRGARPHGAGRGASSAPSHSRSKTPSSTTSTTGGKVSVSEHLARNTQLAQKLEGLLNVHSLTALQMDAHGFKNLGQFVAAAHVSHNLGIPFDQLKAEVVGQHESLGKAIHQLSPHVNAKNEAKKAQQEAKQDLEESEHKS